MRKSALIFLFIVPTLIIGGACGGKMSGMKKLKITNEQGKQVYLGCRHEGSKLGAAFYVDFKGDKKQKFKRYVQAGEWHCKCYKKRGSDSFEKFKVKVKKDVEIDVGKMCF